jgi:hypothetical protein
MSSGTRTNKKDGVRRYRLRRIVLMQFACRVVLKHLRATSKQLQVKAAQRRRQKRQPIPSGETCLISGLGAELPRARPSRH